MASFKTESIRTIALVGQSASGKTLLSEALLAKSGAIGAMGSLERGTTVSDFDPMERKYAHSLASSVMHMTHNDTRIHLVDTPGYPDFMGQAMTALEAVETAAVVINAQTGIGMITSRMMEWAKGRGLDRMIIVNKIDADDVDLPALVEQIQDAFGKECLPINLPARQQHQGRRLLLQSVGRVGLLERREGAPRADRPGRRGRPEVDGDVPRAGRRRCRRSCTSRSSRRCAKGTWCRSVSCRRRTAPASASCST